MTMKFNPEKNLASGELLRMLHFSIDHAFDPAVWIGPDAKFFYANASACRNLGYTREEMLGMSVTDINSYFSSEKWAEHWKELKTQKSISFESVHRRKDGSLYPVEISANYLECEGKEYNCIFFREITDMDRKEADMSKFRNAIEQTVDLVVITDTNDVIEYVNPALVKKIGYTFKELVGSKSEIFRPVEHDEKFYKKINKIIFGGKIWNGEMVVKRKDGKLLTATITISPISDRTGKITHIVVIMRDISQDKKIEAQLIQSEKLASIGIFVSGIAHEINNPLTAILGYSQMLVLEPDLSIDVKEKLEVIVKQAGRSVNIIKNLHKFAQGKSSGKTEFMLNRAIESSIDLYKYRLEMDNVTIHMLLDKNVLRIVGDMNMIEQVFLHIIINAHDEMVKIHDGGNLTVKTKLREGIIAITFENTGPHIPEQILKKIFDPFYTTKDIGQGTGLGLSVSYGIIKNHGGKIWAENITAPKGNGMEKTGVRFIIELPASQKAVCTEY